jgi:hypothetical protein
MDDETILMQGGFDFSGKELSDMWKYNKSIFSFKDINIIYQKI